MLTIILQRSFLPPIINSRKTDILAYLSILITPSSLIIPFSSMIFQSFPNSSSSYYTNSIGTLPFFFFLQQSIPSNSYKIVSTKDGWRQSKAASPHCPKNGKQTLQAATMTPRAWRRRREGGRDGVRSACTRALMAPGTRLEDDIKQQVQRSVHCHSRWMSSCGLVNRPPTPPSSSPTPSPTPSLRVSLQKRPTRFVLRTDVVLTLSMNAFGY